MTNGTDAGRRAKPRGPLHLIGDGLYSGLRFIARHAQSFYTAFGIYLTVGVVLVLLGVLGFAAIADLVEQGATEQFDAAAMQWMVANRLPVLDRWLLDVTALGTGLVVMFIVGVAALFLALTEHRYSALLLLFATGGGLAFNTLLKLAYDRPRPSDADHLVQVLGTSFPSGHAMSSVIVYGTVAYLAARLQKHRWQRWLTMLVAIVLILAISASRVYLGVHYPSDVIAGIIIGTAWAAFCMAGLEAVNVFAKRFKPQELQHERDLDPAERAASGLTP